jgi:hypothetical protein
VKTKIGLPSNDGAVGVARSLEWDWGRECESWQITVWCDWHRLDERLVPPNKITTISLTSLSFAQAVNKHFLIWIPVD